MGGIRPASICRLIAASAAFYFAAVEFSPSHARYQAIARLNPSSANVAQQEEFHNRAAEEYGSYDQSSSKSVRGWRAYLRSLEDEQQDDQLSAIYKNALDLVRYQEERQDVWSTAGETISRGYGDCDDYAHVFLTAAGLVDFDLTAAWFVAGLVSAGGSKPIGHAIAVVATYDGRQFVLDNLYGYVVLEKDHKHFKPVYAINMGEQAFYMQVNTALASAF